MAAIGAEDSNSDTDFAAVIESEGDDTDVGEEEPVDPRELEEHETKARSTSLAVPSPSKPKQGM